MYSECSFDNKIKDNCRKYWRLENCLVQRRHDSSIIVRPQTLKPAVIEKNKFCRRIHKKRPDQSVSKLFASLWRLRVQIHNYQKVQLTVGDLSAGHNWIRKDPRWRVYRDGMRRYLVTDNQKMVDYVKEMREKYNDKNQLVKMFVDSLLGKNVK
jgi:hypothetical protein